MVDTGINEKRLFDLQRRVVSHMTSASWMTVPHVSFIYEPDITDFYKVFNVLAKDHDKFKNKLTINTAILKMIAEGLKEAPSMNAFVDYNHSKGEGSILLKDDINIAIPWLLPDGRMITPTLFDCGKKSLSRLQDDIIHIKTKIENTNINELLFSAIRNDTIKEIKKFNLGVIRRIIAGKITRNPIKGLKGKEKERYYQANNSEKLTKEDLLNATLSVSNIGSLYKDLKGCFGMLQIIPPQIVAIGINALQEKPGIYLDYKGEKVIGIRKYLPLTIVFDHRPIDFSNIIPFIKKCDEIFKNPDCILNW